MPNIPDNSMTQPASFQWLTAEQDADKSGREEQKSKDIGEDQGAGDRLGDQDKTEGDIENPQHNLPHEPSPSLCPPGMDNLKSPADNGDDSKHESADDRRESQIGDYQ